MKSIIELVRSPDFFRPLSCLELGIEGMGIRRQAREVALQALFMIDFNNEWSSFNPASFFEHFVVENKYRDFSEILILGVIKNKEKLDAVITRASENWSIHRMPKVDRSLLRLSCYELCCLPEIPFNVTINEAIEISKNFGSEDSPIFVNGVLDKISSYIDAVLSEGYAPEQVAENFSAHIFKEKIRA